VHGPQSLDGLLSDDEQPRGVWRVYKACGAVNGTLIRVNSTATTDGVTMIRRAAAAAAAAISAVAMVVMATPGMLRFCR